MASVQASGSPSETSAAAFHTQLRSEPTLGESFMSGTTGIACVSWGPIKVSSDQRGIAKAWTAKVHTVVVRANLERLVPPHDQPSLLVFAVLEQPNIARATLFPLPALAVESEKLGTHLEDLLLLLFIGLDINLLCKANDRLEMHVDFTLGVALDER